MLAGILVMVLKVDWWKVIISIVAVLIAVYLFPAEPMIPFIVAIIALSILTAITPGESKEWLGETWFFTKQILPLLAAGVLVAGFLLGGPEGKGIIP